MNENLFGAQQGDQETQDTLAECLRNALLWLDSGRPDNAEETLAKLTRTRPNAAQAWLLRGLARKELGDRVFARGCYAKALALAQQGAETSVADAAANRWENLWRDATEMVERDRRMLIEGTLEKFQKQFGRASLRRVEAAFDVLLSKKEPRYPDARQRPVFLFFPEIRVQPFYDPSEFAWAKILEENTAAIQQELRTIAERKRNVERFYDGDRSIYKTLMPDWEAYFFYRWGCRYDDNHLECPTTSDVLKQLPLCHIPNFSPETLFSFIAPHGRIKPHRGVSNIRLVAHLPLLIPGTCSLTVGGVEHNWKEGEVIVFDDTFVHEARNNTPQERAILLVDVWHPDLIEEERCVLTQLISALSNFEPLPDDQGLK